MRTRPLAGLLLLLSILALPWLIAPSSAVAQNATALEFVETSAVANFPESIQFKLVAESDVAITDVQLFWHAASASPLTLAEPDFSADNPITATAEVDMSARYLPPGLDIEYFWRITDDRGQIHESEPESLLYQDIRFDWQSMSGGLLTVWWYRGSEDYARDILNTANQTLLDLGEQYGLRADQQIRIVIYGDDGDFASALPPNSADWIGGVAYSDLNHIVAQITPNRDAEREVARMIPHEISHVVVHQSSRNPYNSPPPWLDEGLATYVQRSDDERLPNALDDAIEDGRLIPIGALKSSFPLDPDQALLSYAESVSVVSFLVESFGSDAVGDLISIYRSEVSHDDAIESVLGISIAELDARWKASLNYAGDQPLDRQSSDSDVNLPLAIGFGFVLALALSAAVGAVAFSLWRTRSYRDQVDDDDPSDSSPETI